MARLSINHVTEYRYSQPVRFGQHRLMFRPRESHDLRLVSATLAIEPRARLRWLHDVFHNSVAIATFDTPSDRLRLESEIAIDHYGLEDPAFPIEPHAVRVPFEYAPTELPDLQADMMRHGPDPDGAAERWARSFLDAGGSMNTVDGLVAMTERIHGDFTYVTREEEGVQPAAETLALGSGSCRDFALLMMEAARTLGLAARFVTGYLYDPALDGGEADGTVGAGATHAWCQIYLPGMGWTEFDPTNGRIGGTNLIRVAVARTPEQAKPAAGTYYGPPGIEAEMSVEVRVRRVG